MNIWMTIMRQEALKILLAERGQKYSEILDIKLEAASDAEVFK